MISIINILKCLSSIKAGRLKAFPVNCWVKTNPVTLTKGDLFSKGTRLKPVTNNCSLDLAWDFETVDLCDSCLEMHPSTMPLCLKPNATPFFPRITSFPSITCRWLGKNETHCPSYLTDFSSIFTKRTRWQSTGKTMVGSSALTPTLCLLEGGSSSFTILLLAYIWYLSIVWLCTSSFLK